MEKRFVSTDNPFAPPLHNDDGSLLRNVFRVEGDTLICGPDTELWFLCWLTGERMGPQEQASFHTLVTTYWPAPVRKVRQLLWIGAMLTFPLLVVRQMWSVYMVACTVLLLMLFVKRLLPKVTLRIAVSAGGRTLRRQHNMRESVRLLACGLIALAVFRYAADVGAVVGVPVSRPVSVVAAVFVILAAMPLSRRVVRPVLDVKPLVVEQIRGGLFYVRHVPPALLRALDSVMTAAAGVAKQHSSTDE